MPSRLWFRLLIGTCLVLAITLGAVVLAARLVRDAPAESTPSTAL